MWFWYHEAIVETLALSKGPRASCSYRRGHATVAEAPREGKGPDGRAAITQLNIPEIQSCGYHAAEAWARFYYMFLLFPVFLQIFPCICTCVVGMLHAENTCINSNNSFVLTSQYWVASLIKPNAKNIWSINVYSVRIRKRLVRVPRHIFFNVNHS